MRPRKLQLRFPPQTDAKKLYVQATANVVHPAALTLYAGQSLHQSLFAIWLTPIRSSMTLSKPSQQSIQSTAVLALDAILIVNAWLHIAIQRLLSKELLFALKDHRMVTRLLWLSFQSLVESFFSPLSSAASYSTEESFKWKHSRESLQRARAIRLAESPWQLTEIASLF